MATLGHMTMDTYRGRSRFAIPAAGLWSLSYGLAGLYWASGGRGYPYGESTRAVDMGAVLVGVDARAGGTVAALFGLAGALVTAAVLTRAFARRAGAAFASSAALVLLLVVPDGRALLAIGELLMLHPDRVEAAAPHQLYCALGGVLWIGAARTLRASDARHGRRGGRRITWVAAALPLMYAVPRLLWAAGLTAGLDPATAAAVTSSEGRARELVFAAAAAGGGLLTLGLTYRWGERVPTPIPLLGGRRIPASMAIVPAGLVSVVLIGAGFTIWRALAAALAGAGPDAVALDSRAWAAWLGNLAWLPWGIALALATQAYRARRRRAASSHPTRCAWPGPACSPACAGEARRSPAAAPAEG
jgi:hypothetical protein